jgi:mutator protein MutT
MRTAKLIAIAVVQNGDRFLVGLRPEGVALAGFWEFPGGKVEQGEEPALAAMRECREESGIEVTVDREIDVATHDYAHDRVHLRFFACHPVDPNSPPAAPFRWVDRLQLAELEFPPANASLLTKLLAAQA